MLILNNLFDLPEQTKLTHNSTSLLAKILPNTQEDILFNKYQFINPKKNFILGRLLAHQAIAGLGIDNLETIFSGERGEPLWPKGVIGSISHSREDCVAIASNNIKIKSLGIDLESSRREITSKLTERICSKEEESWCLKENYNLRTLLIFSAKESIYKALYPLCKKFFGFKAVELIPLGEGIFQAKLLTDLGNDLKKYFTFTVNYCLVENYIISLTIIFK